MLRYERKYLVPNYLLPMLRTRVMPFVRPDKYTTANNDGIRQYTVRSIYFDNQNLDFYIEKKEGLLKRRKFRIRGYNSYEPGSKVVFEIKRKIENRIKKHRSRVLFENVGKMLQTGDIYKYVIADASQPDSLDDAARFMFHVKKSLLEPTVLIVYEREAYHGKLNHGVRITFDKNIRSRQYPAMDSLYDDGNSSFLFNNHFILEIKYFADQMPLWARSLVQEFKIRNDALSKYTIGFDASSSVKKAFIF